MKSAKKTSKMKQRASHFWDIFTEWLFMTMVLVGTGATFMIGAVCAASAANSLRMTGYLDALFGIYTIGAVYILVWLPVLIIVYYFRQE
tara:strand:+ start:770 stop:1036 length:267 start_codon:yes stop_codon:yes gene_type:complete